MVFLNDYSIIQVKFISCGPAVLLKGSHCISLILLYIYFPLQMCPYLINTVIINIVYQCFLLFYATTPTWVCFLKILLSHDFELNPGDFINGFFNFCNWNVNSLSKDNFHRVQLLEAHNSDYNYDLISQCETSLNDSVELPETLLDNYTSVSSNSPYNRPHGRV